MTILYPEKFWQSPSAGFDGVWDWDFLKDALPRGIMPMDIDGLFEIEGEFLIFETKAHGKEVPNGQRRVLESLIKTSSFTVVILWGKDAEGPKYWQWFRKHFSSDQRQCTAREIWEFVHCWGLGVEGKRRGRGLTDLLRDHCGEAAA